MYIISNEKLLFVAGGAESEDSIDDEFNDYSFIDGGGGGKPKWGGGSSAQVGDNPQLDSGTSTTGNDTSTNSQDLQSSCPKGMQQVFSFDSNATKSPIGSHPFGSPISLNSTESSKPSTITCVNINSDT